MGYFRCRKMENFFQNTGGVRFSGLYRRMCMEAQDASTPGSPSDFSRRRDGIPTSALICSRKNTKIWTNEKQFLWMVGSHVHCVVGVRISCMFECEQYSEPIWNYSKPQRTKHWTEYLKEGDLLQPEYKCMLSWSYIVCGLVHRAVMQRQ